jgi:hypothetical protein
MVVQVSGRSSTEIIVNFLPWASASFTRCTVAGVLLLRLA